MDEFATLALDKPPEKEFKTDSQLKRHTVDQHYESKPIDRAVHILTVGEEVQKLSVISSLPQLLTDDGQQCLLKIIPKVQQALPNASVEFHMQASKTLQDILRRNLLQPRTFTQTFLQSILSSIDSREDDVAKAWLATLLNVIDILPIEVVKKEILMVATIKAQHMDSDHQRIIGCKLIGQVAPRLDVYLLKKEVVPVVQSLCQDVRYEVRACICEEMPQVAKGLGAEGVRTALLPSMVELASDDSSEVRVKAVGAIVAMLPMLPPDINKLTIVPLLKKLCEQSLQAHDEVMVAVADQLGRLCLGLKDLLTDKEKSYFLDVYTHLAQLGVPHVRRDHPRFTTAADLGADGSMAVYITCREKCASNLPAMWTFGTPTGPPGFHDQLYSTFCELAADPYYNVRRIIACSLHEVIRLMGKAGVMARSELVKLLRDDAEEVLCGLVTHLSITLELLAQAGALSCESTDPITMETANALLKCDQEIATNTHNWRLQEELLVQFECLPRCFPSDFINMNFVPVIMTKVKTVCAWPCRMAAARTLLVILRYNTKLVQRNIIRSQIFQEIGRSRSCHIRLVFIKMCKTAMDLFSRSYFKEHFFTPLLGLVDDPVPNIRLTLVKMFPALKRQLRIPKDRRLLALLESAVRTVLNSEKDRDVSAELRIAIQAMDGIEIPLDTTREDAEEQRRLQEEAGVSAGSVMGPRRAKTDDSRGVKNAPGKKAFTSRRYEERISQRTNTSGEIRIRKPPPAEPKTIIPDRISKDVPGRLTAQQTSSFSSRKTTLQTPTSPGRLSYKDSLEDEFYVDAGIRIPQQLAASEFSRLPSRIPNVRELLFKNRNTSVVQHKEVDESLNPKRELKSDYGAPLLNQSSSSESKTRYVTAPKQNNPTVSHKPSSISSTQKVAMPQSTVPAKKQFGPVSASKRNSGIFNTKADMQSSPNGRVTSTGLEKLKEGGVKQGSTVIANRRHSYMEGEKYTKEIGNGGKSQGNVTVKKSNVNAENRRHSYIERVRVTVEDRTRGQVSTTIRSDGNDNRKMSTVTVNKRHSYTDRDQPTQIQGSRSNNDVLAMRKTASRNLLGSTEVTNRRKSMLYVQNQSCDKSNQRVSSLDRESRNMSQDDIVVKRRSLLTQPSAKFTVGATVGSRRHSSLERDDLERLKGPRRLSGLLYPRVHAYTQEMMTTRIPRGAASCHSSPGSSRAPSPTLRQRTAPNSRASSPIGSRKLQRLSLGSLHSYMGSVRMGEPSSRLPVRKESSKSGI